MSCNNVFKLSCLLCVVSACSGARCFYALPVFSAVKKVVGVSCHHPLVTAAGLGFCAYELYTYKYTAPYVQPVVHKGLSLVNSTLKVAHNFLYIRPLERALAEAMKKLGNLAQGLQTLTERNKSTQQTLGKKAADAQALCSAMDATQQDTGHTIAHAMNNASQCGQALNGIMRSIFDAGGIAASICSRLSACARNRITINSDFKFSFKY